MISSIDAVFSVWNEICVKEPVGVGTRAATPSILPCIEGITRPIALAAPVLVGIMLKAAARARRKSA